MATIHLNNTPSLALPNICEETHFHTFAIQFIDDLGYTGDSTDFFLHLPPLALLEKVLPLMQSELNSEEFKKEYEVLLEECGKLSDKRLKALSHLTLLPYLPEEGEAIFNHAMKIQDCGLEVLENLVSLLEKNNKAIRAFLKLGIHALPQIQDREQRLYTWENSVIFVPQSKIESDPELQALYQRFAASAHVTPSESEDRISHIIRNLNCQIYGLACEIMQMRRSFDELIKTIDDSKLIEQMVIEHKAKEQTLIDQQRLLEEQIFSYRHKRGQLSQDEKSAIEAALAALRDNPEEDKIEILQKYSGKFISSKISLSNEDLVLLLLENILATNISDPIVIKNKNDLLLQIAKAEWGDENSIPLKCFHILLRCIRETQDPTMVGKLILAIAPKIPDNHGMIENYLDLLIEKRFPPMKEIHPKQLEKLQIKIDRALLNMAFPLILWGSKESTDLLEIHTKYKQLASKITDPSLRREAFEKLTLLHFRESEGGGAPNLETIFL